MKIKTEEHAWNIYEGAIWSAIDTDSYDGPGSAVGNGTTEQQAIEDLCEQIVGHLDEANDILRHENRCLREEIHGMQGELIKAWDKEEAFAGLIGQTFK